MVKEYGFQIDENGFIKNRIVINPDNVPEGVIKQAGKDPRERFIRPQWNGIMWQESASPAEIEEKESQTAKAIEDFRNQLIQGVKSATQAKIESILPITKQMNLIREGKTDDPAFQEVDNYRKISDSIEEEINKLQTLDELMNYKIRII